MGDPVRALPGAASGGADPASLIDLDGASVAFTPGEVRAGDYTFGVGGAGSCMLVLQTVWPALMGLAEPSRIMLRGGTHTPKAPPFQFIQRGTAARFTCSALTDRALAHFALIRRFLPCHITTEPFDGGWTVMVSP